MNTAQREPAHNELTEALCREVVVIVVCCLFYTHNSKHCQTLLTCLHSGYPNICADTKHSRNKACEYFALDQGS